MCWFPLMPLTLPQHTYGYGLTLNSFSSLCGLVHTHFLVCHSGKVVVFSQGALFFRFVIMLLTLNHILECRNVFVCAPLHAM